jgi:hypothetical protein
MADSYINFTKNSQNDQNVFFTYTPFVLTIIQAFSPTDAELDNIKNNLNFALKFKLFLILSNCSSVGEKTLNIIIKRLLA